MERLNEHNLKVYELHEKGFVAKVIINRSELKWDYFLTDANKKTVMFERNKNFFSEAAIEAEMTVTINDCIANPEEYYN